VLRRLRIENFVLIREADLDFAPGLNAITGETGAGKTILTQAIGLLLGAAGDAGYVGPGASEAYVEAELDLPDGLLADASFETLAELRPEDEDGLVAARRVFADGRTRAYAWGRAVPREDLAALVERLLAMSGQFEQRRLARPAFQLDALDAFVGEEHLRLRAEHGRAWRALQAANRRRDELAATAAGRAERLGELEELVDRTEGLEPGHDERLRAERDRLLNVTGLAEAAGTAAEALAPELGDAHGAAELVSRAAGALGPATALAPELEQTYRDLGEAEIRIREAGSDLRAFLASLEAEPGRLEEVEGDLERITDALRRFHASSYEELLTRAEAARAEIDALAAGADPLAAADAAVAEAAARVDELASALSGARAEASGPFAEAVAGELAGLGMGDGEFRADLSEREHGPTGRDRVAFLVRPNAGLPFAPVAETASGGELSRVNLALRAVAHAGAGEPTVVFDEIDAGIGGRTAHAVADALARIAGRAQILAITHLPQIASVAEAHLRVEKVPGDPTHTRIHRLSDDERREEVERMLGGAEFLDAVRQPS
jgi:DNA repair protein RecN (Recombination protein N)